MTTKRTVKYHVPQQGLYVYARTEEGRTELIVLNSTDNFMFMHVQRKVEQNLLF